MIHVTTSFAIIPFDPQQLVLDQFRKHSQYSLALNSIFTMPRPSKRRLQSASVAQAGGLAPKRQKLTLIGDNQASLSEYEEDSDGQWEVDESGDSNISSNSDNDEVLLLSTQNL
jgi:hypothetical protein